VRRLALPLLFLLAASVSGGCAAPPPAISATPLGTSSESVRRFPTPVPSPTPPPPAVGPFEFVRTGQGGSIQMTGNDGVALTFDDGPDPAYTPLFLDLLASHNIKATFCVVGHRAAAHPDLIARIAAEGHTLCNHSWNHALDLSTWSDSAIIDDLQRTNDAIIQGAPGAVVHYFRAPGGNFTSRLVSIANSLGMEGLEWRVDPKDWNSAAYGTGQAMVDHLVDVVLRWTYPGCIVLAHDLNKPDTLAAFEILLPIMKEHLTLVALPPVPPSFAA
jgi:peptidoglycan/xylan/chitin deacetylase (PgdA/CDA1 family)